MTGQQRNTVIGCGVLLALIFLCVALPLLFGGGGPSRTSCDLQVTESPSNSDFGALIVFYSPDLALSVTDANGASVPMQYEDWQDVGVAGLSALNDTLAPGDYTLRASRRGREIVTQVVNVPNNQTGAIVSIECD